MPHSKPLRWILAAAAIVATLPARAQLTGQNKPAGTPNDTPNDTPPISVTTRLVVETVVVKDKKGAPIDNLTAKDFTITEDGVAQKVAFCEHQSLPDTPAPLTPPPGGQQDIKIYNRLARTQITTETPGEVRYKDRRLLALYFVMSAMPPADQIRALTAAQKFVRTQMTSADLVAIMR